MSDQRIEEIRSRLKMHQDTRLYPVQDQFLRDQYALDVERLLFERDALATALREASERLGELTRPPWNDLTPLVAEVRDEIRAALAGIEAVP